MKRATIILAAIVVLSDCPLYAGDRVIDRGDWPETTEMVAGRLAIQDHGMQQGAHVLSVIVELQNGSGHALDMEFDPHDLRIEMFNSVRTRVKSLTVQGVLRAWVPQSMSRTPSQARQASPLPVQLAPESRKPWPVHELWVWSAAVKSP